MLLIHCCSKKTRNFETKAGLVAGHWDCPPLRVNSRYMHFSCASINFSTSKCELRGLSQLRCTFLKIGLPAQSSSLDSQKFFCNILFLLVFFGKLKYFLVQTRYLFKFIDFISCNQERRTRNFELSSSSDKPFNDIEGGLSDFFIFPGPALPGFMSGHPQQSLAQVKDQVGFSAAKAVNDHQTIS